MLDEFVAWKRDRIETLRCAQLTDEEIDRYMIAAEAAWKEGYHAALHSTVEEPQQQYAPYTYSVPSEDSRDA